MSLDDLFAADAFSQRALDLLHDRDAAEDIDVLHDVDAIAAVVLATLAVAKRLSIVGDQLATLTASIDRLPRSTRSSATYTESRPSVRA